MLIVLIEPDASLRRLIYGLIAHADTPVHDFATPQDALAYIQAAPVVVTILSVNAEALVLQLLAGQAARHMPVFVSLPPGIVVQLLHTQRRFDRLLGEMRTGRSKHVLPTDVTAAQWDQIVAVLPSQDGIGRPWANQRVCLNGILWVVHTHSAWHLMPIQYGNYVTCWRRWHAWQRDGTWQRIETLLAS